MSHYWQLFVELIVTPFHHLPLIWGIVPVYFGLVLNELTSSKANFRTALQTGFSFIWSALQWLYPTILKLLSGTKIEMGTLLAVEMVVTLVVLALGIVAFFSGLFRRFPPYVKFLGHTRFSNYFMIAIFPIQASYLEWSWDRLIAIVIFALPIWAILHFGLMPLRK